MTTKLRTLILTGAILVMALGGAARAEEDGPTAGEKLNQAIEYFDQADYQKAADLLREISDEDLESEDQQIQLQRYLSMSQQALASIATARQNMKQGEAALKSGDTDRARKCFEKVKANRYAPADLKNKAEAGLRDLDKPSKASSSEPAESPDYRPMTTARREPLAEPAAPPPAGGSLVEQLSEEYELLWQQAVKTFRETEGKIRKAVLAEDFEEAHRLLDYARQTIEQNRRYASPAAQYDDYKAQGAALEQFVLDEEREYQERLIREKQVEVAKREQERVDRVKQTKERQVSQLLDQAVELRKERRYEDAIQVLRSVLAIDPDNQQAAWMRDTLEDFYANSRDRAAENDVNAESQDLLIETDEASIPWHKDITYPKNWPEISARRTGTEEASESAATRQTRRKLESVAPELKFDARPFSEVVDALATLTGLSFVPNWAALEAAAVEKDKEVTIPKIANVKFEKALKLILDVVGGGETELAYEIDDGVVRISTKEDLSRNRVTRVYDVSDLLIRVPTFRGRNINLDQIGQQSQQGGLGGGRFLQGGGGGGAQGGQNIFGGGGGGGQQNDPEDQPGAPGTDRITPIITLIQQTIDPESWRDAGGNVGTIQSLNNQIIVTQTATAQAQLRDLLKQLRQSRAMQIAVEARYITITRNWVEQLGVDLDVILNNGNAGFDRTTVLDPATNNPVLVPRQFVRNGFTPGAPGNVGINLPTVPFQQPYGQPGLVPAVGNVGPAWGTTTPIPIVNNTLDLSSPSNTNIASSLGALANQTPAFQMFGAFLDNIQVDFLIRATQVDRRASDLDAPRLVLFNGQRATFESFIEQDYVAALIPIIGDNAGAFAPQVATALTGRSLDVHATVSADRKYVTMTVRTFTRVLGGLQTVFFGGSQTVGSGFIQLATQTTQQIRTTVSVPDGGTLLIGGLKQAGERETDAGVPILSRIPILKRAYSNTSTVKDDQILLILIKPTILIQEEAEAEAFPTLSSATPP